METQRCPGKVFEVKVRINMKIARVVTQKNQALLSIETGIDRARLSLIERGLVRPWWPEAKKIADALNSKVINLFPELTEVEEKPGRGKRKKAPEGHPGQAR